MKRLVLFGCSYTYGIGLPDCNTPAHNMALAPPSKLVWGSLLGDLLKREVVNTSYPGGCMKRVTHTIQNTEFKQDDIAIILWPQPARYVRFPDEDGYLPQNIHPSLKFDYCITYYKHIHSFKGDRVNQEMMYNLAALHLNLKGINTYHLFPYKQDEEYLLVDFNKDILPFNFMEFYQKYPKGLDEDLEKGVAGHMGVEGNEVLATDIYNFIKT